MFIIRDLKICHYDVVWSICPVVIVVIVDSICFAGKIQPLDNELVILLKKGTPLNRSNWPIEYVLIDKIVEAVNILSPLNNAIWLSRLHFILAIFILFPPNLQLLNEQFDYL
jgi:hypothetical protein